MEECYGGTSGLCTDSEFCALVDCLTGGRDDSGLFEALLTLYEKTRGFAGTYNTLFSMETDLRENAKCPPFSTPWGIYLRQNTADAVRSAMFSFNSHAAALAEDAAAAKAYLPAFEADLAALSSLADALERGYEATRAAVLAFPRARLGSLKEADTTQESAAARKFRETFYTQIQTTTFLG